MPNDVANEEDKSEERPRKKNLSMRGVQEDGNGDSGYRYSTVECQKCGAIFTLYSMYKLHFETCQG
jgi:hypothetical protein